MGIADFTYRWLPLGFNITSCFKYGRNTLLVCSDKHVYMLQVFCYFAKIPSNTMMAQPFPQESREN